MTPHCTKGRSGFCHRDTEGTEKGMPSKRIRNLFDAITYKAILRALCVSVAVCLFKVGKSQQINNDLMSVFLARYPALWGDKNGHR